MFLERSYALQNQPNELLKYLVILQSYLFLGCAFTVLGSAPTFGQHHECNRVILVAIFAPFRLLPIGRIVFLTICSTATVVYTIYLVHRFRHSLRVFLRQLRYLITRKIPHSAQGPVKPNRSQVRKNTYESVGELVLDKRLRNTVLGLLLYSALLIVNTELLKMYNDRKIGGGDNSWTFGQVNKFSVFFTCILTNNSLRSCHSSWLFFPCWALSFSSSSSASTKESLLIKIRSSWNTR